MARFEQVRELAGRLTGTDTIRLAVTGLSRAGKTVFITSLIHNLLAVARGHRGALPRLHDAGIAERLAAARVVPPATEAVARFPYAENLAAMAAAEPNWPPTTADIAQISLELTLARDPARIGRFLGSRKVTLEILDYPGEWLLDLPLLDRDYAAWSADTIRAARHGIRAGLSGDFLLCAAAIDPDAPADEAAVHRAHAAYKAYLEGCRDRHGLRFLQPGRFLCPGPWGDLPLMWFAPLPDVPAKPRPGSNAALMAARFDAYRADIRGKFFERHFQRFDRQIVLVDVLGALNAGEDAFADTARAIGEIARGFAYGGTLFQRLFGARIDRVYFAATKADHVPAGRRDALESLLRHLAGRAAEQARLGFGTLASVRSTVDDVATLDGQTVAVVKGLVPGSDTPKKLFPGDIPLKPPPPEFWTHALFTMPGFLPPRLDPRGTAGIPNLDLDSAVAFLMGDKL